MLKIFGESGGRLCDGVSRRDFLKIGGLGFGGLSLPQLLQAEQLAGIRKSHKAVIMIYLPGGPPHQDMFDLKMNAPSEIRGEFRPISTKVPGFQIFEVFTTLAGLMDRCAVIRSVVGATDRLASFQCMPGCDVRALASLRGRPRLASYGV